MKLKIGIVEDSIENVQTLQYLLSEISPEIQFAGTAGTLEEARQLLKQPLDLAFLDIQLKEGTIFEVLEEMQKANDWLPPLIFITAHGSFDYATKALRFAALDFLTKPLSKEELRRALERYVHRSTEKPNQSAQIRFILELLRGNMQAPRSIGVPLTKGVLEFVDLADILYLEADETMCTVHQITGAPLHSTRHLGYFLDLLSGNPEFIQISKSCLVNSQHVKRYAHREKELILKNGKSLLASHRFSKPLKARLIEQDQRGSSLWEKIFG